MGGTLKINIKYMRIKYQSADVSEETMKAFASYDFKDGVKPWTEKIMTTDLSPNVLIDNPQTYSDYIKERYGSPISKNLVKFNMKDAEELAELKQQEAAEIINNAKAQAQAIANSMFEMTIE